MLETELKLAKVNDPIKQIFDKINFDFIYKLVKDKYSPNGADGYDPVSLFKALLLIYLGEADSERTVAKKLSFDSRAIYLCGFDYYKTPTHATFHYFRKRLDDDTFFEILHNLVAQAITLKLISGSVTPVDATHLWAYSNKFGKKTCDCKGKCHHKPSYSDKDADWGHKSKNYSFFGYKVHLLVDASSQLPIYLTLTPASSSDTSQLKPLVSSALDKHKNLKIEKLPADKAYDCLDNYAFLIDEYSIEPFIPLKNYKNPVSIGEISLSPDGHWLCPSGNKLINWGYDKKRNRFKLRCPHVLGKCICPIANDCSSSTYGRTYHISPAQDYRIIGFTDRNSPQWEKIYNKRTASERVNSLLKSKFGLTNNRFRGKKNVTIHSLLSVIAYVSTKISQHLCKPQLAYV